MAACARRMLISVLTAIAALLLSVGLQTGSAAAATERGFTDQSTVELPRDPGKIGLAAVYSCSRSVSFPAYYIDVDCSVYSGAIRLVVTCSDGYTFYSPIIFAGNRFIGRGTCGPPWTVLYMTVQEV